MAENKPYESPDDLDAQAKPLQAPPAKFVALRSVLSILGGFLAMTIGVVLYQGLFLMLPMYISDPEKFSRMMEYSQDAEKLRTAVESGDFPVPSTGTLAFTLVMDFFCAAAGGFCAAWIAARGKFGHGIVIAALMTTYSIGYAALSELEAVLPDWVPWTRALLCMPVGIILGAWLRTGCCKKRDG